MTEKRDVDYGRRTQNKLLLGLLIILGVIPVIVWYKPHFIVTGNDFFMPFDPGLVFKEIWSGWLNYEGIGGSSSSDQLPNLIYVGFLYFWHHLGIPLNVAEAGLFGIIICLAGISVWILTGRWWQSPLARFTSSCLYMLSPVVMMQWHIGESTGMIGYSLAPLVLYFIDIALYDSKLPRWYWLAFAITCLALSSPAHIPPVIFGEVAVPSAVFLIATLGFRSGQLKIGIQLRRLGLLLLAGLGINFWWLLPAAQALASGSIAYASGYFKLAATTAPPDISVPVSLFDQVTGFGFWLWHLGSPGFPIYQFARRYSTIGMKTLVATPLILAMFGTAWWFTKDAKVDRRLITAGFTLWIVGFLLLSGFKGPFDIYQWVYFHWVPFRVFRSPYFDFPVAQPLGLALLAGVGTFWINTKPKTSPNHVLALWRSYAYCGVITILATIIVFPMYGSMFQTRDSTGHLMFYSAVPNYVKSFAANVNKNSYCNIYFPVGDSYESSVSYSWYQGGSAPFDQLFHCNLIGGTTDPVSNGQAIGNALDGAISTNLAPAQFEQLLTMIGVTEVVVPLDYAWSYNSIGLQSSTVMHYLNQIKGFFSVRTYGKWIEFKVRNNVPFVGAIALPNISYFSNLAILTKKKDHLLFRSLMYHPKAEAFITPNDINQTNNLTVTKGNTQESGGTISRLPNGVYKLKNLQGTILVIAHNSYDPSWTLAVSHVVSPASQIHIRHVEVNGFQNGWLVTGRGTFILDLRYPPSRLIIIGTGISMLIVLSIILRIVSTSKYQKNDPPTSESNPKFDSEESVPRRRPKKNLLDPTRWTS